MLVDWTIGLDSSSPSPLTPRRLAVSTFLASTCPLPLYEKGQRQVREMIHVKELLTNVRCLLREDIEWRGSQLLDSRHVALLGSPSRRTKIRTRLATCWSSVDKR